MNEKVTIPLKDKPSSLSKTAFLAIYGGVYENSPWVAEALWDAGTHDKIDHVEGFAKAAKSFVDQADDNAKYALIRAHPDLAGRAAAANSLTHSSAQEQSSAGLDNCSAEELERFQTLNAAYRAKFAFPFILAVKNMHRSEILDVFSRRLENSAPQEFQAAMAEIHKIAALRLNALAAAPDKSSALNQS